MESRTGENLGGFHLPEGRAQSLETSYEIGDDVRKPVHRFGQTDKRVRTFLIETPHPRGDGEWADQENTSGLGESPTPCGAKFEDRQPVSGWIMGPSMGLDLFYPGILDADLFAQELDLLLLAIPLSPL